MRFEVGNGNVHFPVSNFNLFSIPELVEESQVYVCYLKKEPKEPVQGENAGSGHRALLSGRSRIYDKLRPAPGVRREDRPLSAVFTVRDGLCG